jgi:hypothetical protein
VTRPLLSAHSFPPDRARPGIGLSVVALHLALLWIANLYWPLQVAVQGVVVQIFRSDVRVDASVIAAKADASLTPDAALTRNPRSISNGSPRVGRAETQLDLPAVVPAAQQSTLLVSTQQLRLSTPSPAAQAAVEVTVPPAPPLPAPVPARQNAPVVVEPAALAASSPSLSVPLPLPSPPPPPLAEQSAQKSAEPRLTQTLPEPPQALPAPAPVVVPAAPPAVAAPVPAVPAPAAAPAPSVALPVTASQPDSRTSAPGLQGPVGISGVPGAAASSALGALGSGLPLPTTGPNDARGAPLNLGPPRFAPLYNYRPPLAVPRRSLSELANEQLRRKPRDPFAETVESAGNIDCLKDTPEGPAQGLLAIGPLLKRAIEEKCKK